MNLCDEADECVFDKNCPFYAPGCEQFEEPEMKLTEKIVGALAAIYIVTALVMPGRKTAKMIEEMEAKMRESIEKTIAGGEPEPEPEPWSQMPACGHIECAFACTYPKGIRPGD